MIDNNLILLVAICIVVFLIFNLNSTKSKKHSREAFNTSSPTVSPVAAAPPSTIPTNPILS